MENLKSYLDGELDLAQQTEVETHIRNDEDLQKMVADFRSISDTLKTADSGEPYGLDQLEQRLAGTAKATNVQANKKTWWLAGVWSLCAFVAILIAFPVFSQSKMTAKNSVLAGHYADSESKPDMAAFKSTAASAAPIVERAKSMAENMDKEPAAAPEGDQFGKDLNYSAKSSAGAAMARPEALAGSTSKKQINGVTEDQVVNGSENAKLSGGSPAKPLPNETEGQFKSDLRVLRDRQQSNSSTSLNDTPHGIYLERSGEIHIKVDDLMRSTDEVTGMVQGFGGFVTSNTMQNQVDGGAANMIIRVPTKSFSPVMSKLRAMGDVLSENSGSQDITTETVDNGARMISWADEEKRLMGELEKAKSNDEKYRIRQQLSGARANLESYKAVVKSLKDRAEYSTINITMLRGDQAEKAGATGNWSGNAFRDAKGGLGAIGQVFGTILIYGGVFIPVWLPFLIAYVVIRKRNS